MVILSLNLKSRPSWGYWFSTEQADMGDTGDEILITIGGVDCCYIVGMEDHIINLKDSLK